MRALRLVAAFLAAVMASTLAPQAGAATDSFTVGNVSAQAGRDETFTVTRISGGKGIYVLFETSDGTAHAGTDYTAVKQLLYFRASQISGTVIVHTAANSNALGRTLAFNAIIASSSGAGAAVKATGSIIEAPVPPPVIPATQTCPDGSVILATATCPAPVPVAQWVTAPLQDGSFARVKANDNLWDMTGPGLGRPLVPGEIVAVYFNGWGNDSDGTTSFAIYALSDGSSGRAKAADLAGVAPVGAPPGLPASWWVPGLVTANKTCTDPRAGHEGQPGVAQGGVYRAAMLAGSHTKLATGATGNSGVMWEVFATGVQQYTAAFTVVTGECLTGQ